MRVLQLCAVDFTAFHMLRTLMIESRRMGWDVEIACSDGPYAGLLRAEGFVHRALPMTRSRSPLAQLRSAIAVARSLRADPPDLLHTHTPAGGLVGRLGAILARWPGPIVHTFHGLPFQDQRLGFVERAFLVLERLLARRTTLFLSQARGDAVRAAAFGIARPSDLVVIGNGTDVSRFAPAADRGARARAGLGLGPDAIVVLCVARLVREKGLLELADAVLSLANRPLLHVLIVGEALPSDRTAVAAELDAHSVVARMGTRWRRLGQRNNVHEVMQAADLFVLPTYREGLPRSIVEAMSSGLPVVASDIPACRELVRDGETGLLVPVRDARSLARALGTLLDDAALRSSMGTRAREIALTDYDERRIVARQIDLLRSLVS